MASNHLILLWQRQQKSLWSLLLHVPKCQFGTKRILQNLGKDVCCLWSTGGRVSVARTHCRNYGTRANHTAPITAQQGLFHVDIPVQDIDESSKPEDHKSFKPKVLRDNEVQYAYNKEMLSASTYLRREREKLMSQPRTEKETYHAKHTPRLFYLERAEYSLTASCLPRSEVVYGEAESAQEDFLERVGADKSTFFLVHFLVDGIECLGRRSDEWLINLNNDARFLRLCVIVRAMCARLSDEELAEVLRFLARTQVRTRSSVLPALYEECCHRGGNLGLPLSLIMLDSWRMIGFPVPRFSDVTFSACGKDIPRLSTPELIQLLYLIGENRGAPDGVETGLVRVLPDHLASLTLTELGAVCTGLFKSVTSPPTTELMMAISDHVCSSDIQTVHSFFVVGILKHFRRQYQGYQHFFQYVANAVTPLLKFYPLMSCMQILLSYATMHICHPQLCNEIADEITQKADQWRSKDATKILWSYGTLQYLPDRPDFLPTVMDQFINLNAELEEYPANLVTSLLSLAYLQLYPWELLNRLFSRAFLQTIAEYMDRTGVDLRRDMLLLDRALEIECPEYGGNRLDESFMLKSDIHSSIAPSIGQQLTSRPEVRFIAGLVRAAVGHRESYKIHSILPQINTLDIEVRLDECNQPIPFNERAPATHYREEDGDDRMHQNSRTKPAHLLKSKNAVALSANLIANLTRGGEATDVEPGANGVGSTCKEPARNPDEGRESGRRDGRSDDALCNVKRILQKPVRAPSGSGEKRLAIVVWARNHSHYGGNKLLGQHAMKRRQLELLGYHVVDVPFQEWTRLMKNRDQQDNVKYMRRKIFNNGSMSL